MSTCGKPPHLPVVSLQVCALCVCSPPCRAPAAPPRLLCVSLLCTLSCASHAPACFPAICLTVCLAGRGHSRANDETHARGRPQPGSTWHLPLDRVRSIWFPQGVPNKVSVQSTCASESGRAPPGWQGDPQERARPHLHTFTSTLHIAPPPALTPTGATPAPNRTDFRPHQPFTLPLCHPHLLGLGQPGRLSIRLALACPRGMLVCAAPALRPTSTSWGGEAGCAQQLRRRRVWLCALRASGLFACMHQQPGSQAHGPVLKAEHGSHGSCRCAEPNPAVATMGHLTHQGAR